MTSVTELSRRRTAPALGTFARYLTVWVGLCIIAGIVLGRLLPAPFQAVGRMNMAEVNIPVALLIWLMIVPMLLKVDFGALHRVAEQWRGIAVTVGVNWLVKPFSMALLGWLFVGWLFRPWLPAAQIDSYIAGLIILGAAPCTAMVFVWSNLTDGEPNFTLRQVALHHTIIVFAFAPIGADRCVEFLRAGGRRRDRAVRLSVGRRAGDRGRRARRGAGHAVGRAHRAAQPALVRARLSLYLGGGGGSAAATSAASARASGT